jgi:hypothetical protein
LTGVPKTEEASMTMAAFNPERSARRPTAQRQPKRASSGIPFSIDRAIRYVGLCLDRYEVWATCVCAALACLTWLGLGIVLFGQPLAGVSPLDCTTTIDCAMRILNPLP